MRCLETEAAFQSTSNVVFATAFEDLKLTRCCNAVIARIETQHHFAEAEFVPPALIFRLNLQRHGLFPYSLSWREVYTHRLKARRQDVNDSQRDQICGTGNRKRNGVTAGQL